MQIYVLQTATLNKVLLPQTPLLKETNILFELQKNNPGHHSLVGNAALLLICHAKHATKFLILDCALQGNIEHMQHPLDQHLHFYKYQKEKLLALLSLQFSGNKYAKVEKSRFCTTGKPNNFYVAFINQTPRFLYFLL